MFNKYHHAKHKDTHYIYHSNAQDDGYRMVLYKDDVVIDRKSRMTGEFVIGDENARLSVTNTMTKSRYKFSVDGEMVELLAIKHKALKKILTEDKVYNHLNPTKEEQEASRFNPMVLLVPVLLIVSSLIIQYFTHTWGRTYDIIAAIPNALAGWFLYDFVKEKAAWLAQNRYGRFGYMALTMVVFGLLGEYIFK